MSLKQKALAYIFFTFSAVLSASDISLPHLFTYVDSSSDNGEIFISEEELEKFSSTEEALESVGISFKESNKELTFHGFWNSSIKIYINDVLMNDPNTGKFDFSGLEISSIRSIRVNPVSTDGSVSVYIDTFYADYTRAHYSVGGYSKSFFSFHDLSPNDAWRLHGSVNYPFVFKDGSSLILQENLSAGYDANHYGFHSTKASYEPTFKDSYEQWQNRYAGWERELLNNSFSAVYSSADLPGATFGFSNLLSWNNQNCGREGGVYYHYEKQEDIISVFAFPVFIPSKEFRLKIIPSYKISNLDYKKDAYASKVHNKTFVQSFSVSEECSLYKFFEFNSRWNYDFCDSNKLVSWYFEPVASVGFHGFDFVFKFPISLFWNGSEIQNRNYPSFDFLYFAEIRKNICFQDDRNFSLFFNSSRNVTNPVFEQLYYSGGGGAGNPELKTESAFSFYAGTEYKGKIDLSLKPFFIFYNEKIGWNQTSSDYWTPENIGSSYNYGFDFSFDSDSLFDFFSFKANYTLCHAKLTTNKKVYGNQIMFTPVHSLNMTGEITPNEALKLSLMYKFVSKKYETNDNTSFIPPQYYVDARFDYKIKKGNHETSVYLLWENIFDFKYTEISNYPGPGASLTLGLNYNF
ncbi:MAG: hypothetical protein MJ181_06430 [Treponema sp.]|nr:hypothetical protein [Treponema sp.]